MQKKAWLALDLTAQIVVNQWGQQHLHRLQWERRYVGLLYDHCNYILKLVIRVPQNFCWKEQTLVILKLKCLYIKKKVLGKTFTAVFWYYRSFYTIFYHHSRGAIEPISLAWSIHVLCEQSIHWDSSMCLVIFTTNQSSYFFQKVNLL